LPDGGGVLDHLVVVLRDQVPSDRSSQRRGQPWVSIRGASGRTVQADPVELLDPRQQVEPEQPGDPEADLGLTVGVDVVALHGHGGAVPDGALDHGVYFRGRGPQALGVHHHGPALDVPVDQDPAAAVAGVPLGEDVLVPGPEVGGVGGNRGRPAAPQGLAPDGEGGVRDLDRDLSASRVR